MNSDGISAQLARLPGWHKIRPEMVADYSRIAMNAGSLEVLAAAITDIVDTQAFTPTPAAFREAISQRMAASAPDWRAREARCATCGGTGWISERVGVVRSTRTMKTRSMAVYGSLAGTPETVKAMMDRVNADIVAGKIDDAYDFARPCGCRGGA